MKKYITWIILLGVLLIFGGVGLGVYLRIVSKSSNNDFKYNDKNILTNSVDKPEIISTKLGSCLFFKEEDCDKGKAYKKDDKLTNVGFIIDNNDYIYSPVNGQLNISKVNSNKGREYIQLSIIENPILNGINITLAYEFTIDGLVLDGVKEGSVKKGQPLAKVNNVNEDQDNVYLRILDRNFDTGDDVLNEVELKKYVNESEN